MANKKMLSGGGTVKNGKRTQWSKAYDKDGKEIDFSKHNKDWFDEYGEPACENKRINMKKIIKLTESDLHRIVKESVNRILSEEVDTGQVMPAYERNMMRHTSSREEEIRKKIRNLRKMIGDYEDENKDTSELVKQLQRLKKEAGYC